METKEELIKLRDLMRFSISLEKVIEDVEERIRDYQETVLKMNDVPEWCWEANLNEWTDEEIDKAIEDKKEYDKFKEIIDNG